jgi:hypothetical protein
MIVLCVDYLPGDGTGFRLGYKQTLSPLRRADPLQLMQFSLEDARSRDIMSLLLRISMTSRHQTCCNEFLLDCECNDVQVQKEVLRFDSE